MSDSKKDLLMAILALDAYNQGYGKGINHGKTKIGNARIIRDSQEVFRDPNATPDAPTPDQSAGFYAVAYDTPYGTVISYRGTDNPVGTGNSGSDIWRGWTIGGGFIGSGSQAGLALDFYSAVTGRPYTERASNAILTGHSLGGGLAGFLSTLSGTEGVGFDHMPFGIAAFVQNWSDYFSGRGSYERHTDNFKGYYVDGEALESVRSGGAQLGLGIALSTLAALLKKNGASVALRLAGLGEALLTAYFERDVPKTSLDAHADLGVVQLHSQALLVHLLFAKQEGHTKWYSIGEELWNASFNDKVGKAAGYSESKKETAKEKLVKNEGHYSPAAKLMAAIAYSALDDWKEDGTGLVYGDTAIRALFDDADELGRAHEVGIGGYTRAIAEILVQFAGQLALDERRQKEAPQAIKGVIREGRNGEFLAISVDHLAAAWKKKGGAAPDIVGVKTLWGELEKYLKNDLGIFPDIRARVQHAIEAAQAIVLSTEKAQSLGVDEATGLLRVPAGKALLTNESKPRTIVIGSNATEAIIDGSGDDVILAGGGNDSISMPLRDRVCNPIPNVFRRRNLAGSPETFRPELQTPTGKGWKRKTGARTMSRSGAKDEACVIHMHHAAKKRWAS